MINEVANNVEVSKVGIGWVLERLVGHGNFWINRFLNGFLGWC